jgi:enhancing lycopene biosynthesis protein 2
VINHFNGEELEENRNALTESARIARGEVKGLDQLKAEDFDVLFVPSGPRMCNFMEF